MINLAALLVFLVIAGAVLLAGTLIGALRTRAAVRRRLNERSPHGAEPRKLAPHLTAAARARLFDDAAFEQAKRHGGSLHFLNRRIA